MKEVRQKPIAKLPKRAASKAGRKGEPISIYPLTPEDAIRAIIQVSPESREKQLVQQKQIRKRT